MDPATVAADDDLLSFGVHPDGATSVVVAAYRFARREPGCNVILTGTGSVDLSTLAAICRKHSTSLARRLPSAALVWYQRSYSSSPGQ